MSSTSTTTGAPPAPFGDLELVRGAMQNWSDLFLGSVTDSPLVRGLVEPRLGGAASVLVVGAHGLELVVGLAEAGAAVTVVTRSVPDARTLTGALESFPGARVVCGNLSDALADGATFDLVLALDDLDRVVSLEVDAPSWQQVLAGVAVAVAPGGRLLVGVQNELGLHRLASLRSRYASNEDQDWAVLATWDGTRPRTREQVDEAVAGTGLSLVGRWSSYADWLRPAVLARDTEQLSDPLLRLVALGAVAAPGHRHDVADPDRVTRAATRAGLLDAFASGWWVEAVRSDGSPNADQPDEAPVVLDFGEARAEFREENDLVVRTGAGGSEARFDLPEGAHLLLEDLVDACAAQQLPALRTLLGGYSTWVREQAGPDGQLGPEHAAASFANLVVGSRQGPDPVVLVPGTTALSANERIWFSLVALVSTLRARGNRHPWPTATDDATLVGILAAMAGLDPADRPDLPGLVTDTVRPDVPTLLARIARLEEQVESVGARSRWFEYKLNERERDMRRTTTEHSRQLRDEQVTQEELRRAVAEVKNSYTFRAGKIVTAPVRKALDVIRQQDA